MRVQFNLVWTAAIEFHVSKVLSSVAILWLLLDTKVFGYVSYTVSMPGNMFWVM